MTGWLRAPARSAGGHLQLLDLLRGLSAFAILFWHYHHFFFPVGATRPIAGYRAQEPLNALFWPFYEHGKYAVLLFWLLSGFVFAHVYWGRQATTSSFIVNRIARLYPLHLATLLAVALLQSLAQARLGGAMIYQHNGIGDFLLQLGFASNWLPGAPYSFNGPIWTVSVEIPAYALFWLLLPVLFRFGIVLPLLLTLGLGHAFVRTDWHLLSAMQCFFAGTALFVAVRAAATPGRLVLLAGLVLLGLWGLGESWMIRPVGALALCCALILALVMLEDLPRPAWLARLNWLGDAGYGVYLWHFPWQLCLFLLVPGLATDHGVAREPWFLLVFMAPVFLVAHLSYRWFETPARRLVQRVLAVRS